MKKIILLFCCFWLSGCTFLALSGPPGPAPYKSLRDSTGPAGASAKTFSFSRIDRVRAGMSYREAAAVLGETITIGYERRDPASDAYSLITISNPYRKEFVRQGDKTYDVFYYFTRVQNADGIISDDELTPLIFEKELLIGRGWDFLNTLKKEG